MADSDDDYDSRRRDKFVRERNDYSSNRNSSNLVGGGGNSGGWHNSNDNNNWQPHRTPHYPQRPDAYGNRNRYNQSSNYNSSNYDHPPSKRGRLNLNNWNEDRNSHSNFDTSYDNNSFSNSNDNTLTQPPYMSFKQFMKGLDDSIDHLEAAKRYNEYKLEFKRKQLVEFFTAHKDEEWFRIKYHPVESVKRKKELKGYVKHRAKVFFDLYDKGLIQSTTIDVEKSDQITDVLDSVIIKLEGGTDFDLKCLERKEVSKEDVAENHSEQKNEMDVENKVECEKEDDKVKSEQMDEESKIENEQEENEKIDIKKEDGELKDEIDKLENNKEDGEKIAESGEIVDRVKQENNENSSNNEIIEKEESEKMEQDQSEIEQKPDGDELKNENEKVDNNQNIIEDQMDNKIDNKEDLNAEIKTESTNNEQLMKEEKNKIEEESVKEENIKEEENMKEEEKKEDQPRPLHKTLSIFLRYLPANVTKIEIENMFKSYPEFLRVALADSTFDKRFQRRGWITFDRTIDIRSIYLTLSSVRIRECEVGAIINRDLSRRIRSVNGIASHRKNVLADLKHTTKIILNLDDIRGVWLNDSPVVSETDENKDQVQESYTIEGLPEPITIFDQKTKNPLLIDVEDCLKEPESTEDNMQDETGEIKEDEPNNDLEPKPLERDEKLIKALDKLIFYLRIVHSLDYYNHIDYPNEDEMPNRIGIMHARGMLPTANITMKEVNDYIRRFEQNISPYLESVIPLTDDEIVKLGKRDVNEEIEKFINDNTKEIKSDKWLCPLSGKKFKGPEFVRKHIETKHEDKLENVKHETEFFNLYLADPRRPQLAEHPFNKPNNQSKQSAQQSIDTHHQSNYGNSGNIHQRINFNQSGGGYNRYNSGGGYNNNYNNNSSYNNNYNRGGNNRFNRKRVYRDLDAPID